MAIKIKFDINNVPELPTMILAKRNGSKIGKIQAYSPVVKDDLNNPAEIVFSVKKYVDGKLSNIWKEITDFRLVWCVEWNTVFEIKVDVEENDSTTKNVYCTELSQSELSQVMLYNIEINTEEDIKRDDYVNPTVFYNPDTPKESLLNRIMEKVPNYKIIHVDNTIKNIQRTFSFDNKSLYDSFIEISNEIGCLFRFNSNIDSNGKIVRGISVYDLENICQNCGSRGEFSNNCPNCNSDNITNGYGEDTTIFISSDELANSIQLTSDTDSVKNCFKLEAGDDLMTATIRNCNANGTDYLWHISEYMKNDMSEELYWKLDSYNQLYNYYQNENIYSLNAIRKESYNNLILKYQKYDLDIPTIDDTILGFANLMKEYYNTLDFNIFLKSKLMPKLPIVETTAKQQLALLTTQSMGYVAVADTSHISLTTADSVVINMAKAIIDNRYKITIISSQLNQLKWTGKFSVTNYADETDTASNETDILINISDNYKMYIEQKLKKSLHEKDSKDYDITGLFKMELSDFKAEIEKYCLDSLNEFYNAGQSCLDILIEQGVSVFETWGNKNPNLYDEIYKPYFDKIKAIESEIKIREKEIELITGKQSNDNSYIKFGIQNDIQTLIDGTRKTLNFQSYIGENLWTEFISFRREDKYANSNYISDGLDNAELFKKALEFIDVAKKEIYKSAEVQHSISCSLKNLLAITKFKLLTNYFSVGNWIRIKIDDVVYKLRLLRYEIDFDNFENISVEFSNVMKTFDGESDQQSIIANSIQMSSTYNSTQRQAEKGAESQKTLNEWSENGIDISFSKIINSVNKRSQSWDEHGMSFKNFNDDTQEYNSEQIKIINSSIIISDDNWETTKTAIGLFQYIDNETGEIKSTYGVNGETIVGKLLIGNNLKLYNDSGSLSFDENGFSVSNDVNTLKINPNINSIFTISNKDKEIISFDNQGNGLFNGNIVSSGGSIGGWNITHYDLYAKFSTQFVNWIKQPIKDESGNLVYTTRLKFDESGNPVYKRDSDGRIIYTTEYVYNEDGSPVYKRDEHGNIIYNSVYVYEEYYDSQGNLNKRIVRDEQGNPIFQNIPVQDTFDKPVQDTENVILYEYKKEILDEYYDNYTILTTKGDVALSVGVTEKDSLGIPTPESGLIKLYNNGKVQATELLFKNSNEDYEPIIEFQKIDKGITKKSFIKSRFIPIITGFDDWQDWDNVQSAISFSFQDNEEDEIHSVLITKYGIFPNQNLGVSCGSLLYRWNEMYTEDMYVVGKTNLGNSLYMTDDDDKSRLVMSVYHDNEHNQGSNLVLSANGNTYIGGGNSSKNLYNLNQHGYGSTLFLSSNDEIQLYTNCSDIEKRKCVVIDSYANITPYVSGIGNIGASTKRWDNIYTIHSPSVLSDEKMKTQISEINKAKELIMKIKPIQYMYTQNSYTKESDRIHYGFSAQQLKSVINEIGIKDCGVWTADLNELGMRNGRSLATANDNEKIYGIRYEELIAPIVEVIQDIENRLKKIESNGV